MIALWVATSYLVKNKRRWYASLLTGLPATFMTAVSMTYILVAEEGLKLSTGIAYPVGFAAAFIMFMLYICNVIKKNRMTMR